MIDGGHPASPRSPLIADYQADVHSSPAVNRDESKMGEENWPFIEYFDDARSESMTGHWPGEPRRQDFGAAVPCQACSMSSRDLQSRDAPSAVSDGRGITGPSGDLTWICDCCCSTRYDVVLVEQLLIQSRDEANDLIDVTRWALSAQGRKASELTQATG